MHDIQEGTMARLDEALLVAVYSMLEDESGNMEPDNLSQYDLLS